MWTLFGSLGCIVAAVLLDSTTFTHVSEAERTRSLLTDVFVPLIIAAPLLYYFSSKLRELAIAHHKLALLASTDSLTEVLNRGAFTTLVDAYLDDVRDSEASGALLVIDVDHFKRINDSLGHDRGDEALRLIAGTIKDAVRSVDLAAWASVDPGPERYKEQMVAPTVAIDGAIATVSGRYIFAIDGTIRHCGYQHFDLVRDAGVWKIQNVTWSVRTFGCGATRARRQ